MTAGSTRNSDIYSGSGGGAGSSPTGNGNAIAGSGLASSITGSSVSRAGGGPGTGSSYASPTAAGSANLGGGGPQGSAGGDSGVVILRYPKAFTITVGGSLTSSTSTVGNDKVTIFTAGTDNVSWS